MDVQRALQISSIHFSIILELQLWVLVLCIGQSIVIAFHHILFTIKSRNKVHNKGHNKGLTKGRIEGCNINQFGIQDHIGVDFVAAYFHNIIDPFL